MLILKKDLIENFVNEIRMLRGKKTFGYFLSEKENGTPSSYFIFKTDARKEFPFEKVSKYYSNNSTAGFLATPQETLSLHRKLEMNGLKVVGVFHTHMRHPPMLSKIDADMHLSNSVWHLIISIKNLAYPRIKIFTIDHSEVKNKMWKITKK